MGTSMVPSTIISIIYNTSQKDSKNLLGRNKHESIRFAQTMKILLYTKDSRLRASPRHGGQGVFLNF